MEDTVGSLSTPCNGFQTRFDEAKPLNMDPPFNSMQWILRYTDARVYFVKLDLSTPCNGFWTWNVMVMTKYMGISFQLHAMDSP